MVVVVVVVVAAAAAVAAVAVCVAQCCASMSPMSVARRAGTVEAALVASQGVPPGAARVWGEWGAPRLAPARTSKHSQLW